MKGTRNILNLPFRVNLSRVLSEKRTVGVFIDKRTEPSGNSASSGLGYKEGRTAPTDRQRF